MFPPILSGDLRVDPHPRDPARQDDNPPPRRGAPARLDLGGDMHAAPYLPAAPPEPAPVPARGEVARLIDLRAHPRFQPRPAPRGLRQRIARAMMAIAHRLAQPRRA